MMQRTTYLVLIALAACGRNDTPPAKDDKTATESKSETKPVVKLAGAWKLVVTASAHAAAGSGISIKLRSTHQVDAVETDTDVTFSTSYGKLVAQKTANGLVLKAGQKCDVPVGTPLSIEVEMGGMFAPAMSIEAPACYPVTLDTADTAPVVATEKTITFTGATGTAAGAFDGTCVVPADELLATTLSFDLTR